MNDGQPARQHVVIQELGFLVNLAITASTEECYSKVLPHMAESSGCVLIHYPTVGAECYLLPLVGVIRDGVQTAFYWFLPCRDLLPVSLFCIQFPGFLVPRCALLFWGIFVRGLRFETFVRVLRSSELSLNNCK